MKEGIEEERDDDDVAKESVYYYQLLIYSIVVDHKDRQHQKWINNNKITSKRKPYFESIEISGEYNSCEFTKW